MLPGQQKPWHWASRINETFAPAISTLRPRWNGYFADDIFKRIFVNEKVWISITILSLFLRVQLTIFQHWFWQWPGTIQPGNKPLSERMMVSLPTNISTSPQWVKGFDCVILVLRNCWTRSYNCWNKSRSGVGNDVLMKQQTGTKWTGYPHLAYAWSGWQIYVRGSQSGEL